MPNKILFCATVDTHFSAFHLPVLEWFKQRNWEVHVAAKGEGNLPFVDKKYNISFERSPIRLRNQLAYRQLKEIIQENGYRLIHCHTPMGGVITRLAARNVRKKGTKVLYTVHGFHFCKGAPLLNWMLYYPIEKQLSKVTDCLITINDEDYRLAVSRRFEAQTIAHVHGIGVNTSRFSPIPADEKLRRRAELRCRQDDFVMFYAAEFNKNKNHRLLLHAMAKIKDKAPKMKLLLAGRGALQEECGKLVVKLGIDHMVDFLGYRNDIDKVLPLCDAAVSSSLREGLPVNIMEAMACGLPVIATRNRGHVELVAEDANGYIVNPLDSEQFADRIYRLYSSSELSRKMGAASLSYVQKYSSQQVERELSDIYSKYMTEEAYG